MMKQLFFGIAALALIAGPVAAQQEPKKDTCTVAKGKQTLLQHAHEKTIR